MEWLETNGIGGFASSTPSGMNTRRYHGLLTAALNPPTGRILLLSKLEETLIVGGRRFELSTNQYTGAVHPRGCDLLIEFHPEPMPSWTFGCDGVTVSKTVFLVDGENTACVEYQISGTRRISRSKCAR